MNRALLFVSQSVFCCSVPLHLVVGFAVASRRLVYYSIITTKISFLKELRLCRQ